MPEHPGGEVPDFAVLQHDHPQRAWHAPQEPPEPHHGGQPHPQERADQGTHHQGTPQQHQERTPPPAQEQQRSEASGLGEGKSVLLQTVRPKQETKHRAQRQFRRQRLFLWTVVLQAAMASGPRQQEGVLSSVLSDQCSTRDVLHVFCECPDDYREALSDTEQDYGLNHVCYRNWPNWRCSAADLLRWTGT